MTDIKLDVRLNNISKIFIAVLKSNDQTLPVPELTFFIF